MTCPICNVAPCLHDLDRLDNMAESALLTARGARPVGSVHQRDYLDKAELHAKEGEVLSMRLRSAGFKQIFEDILRRIAAERIAGYEVDRKGV